MGKLQKIRTTYIEDEILEIEEVPTYIDLVAFCQLRWNFVWQRPQHLMSRWARYRRVFFVEEPIFGGQESFADVTIHNGVHVVVPHLREDFTDYHEEMKHVITQFFHSYKITSYILWYWTPMSLGYSRHFSPQVTVYDCMDELSAFASAPPQLKQFERELMARADLVFTGGESLYEARRYQHPNIHAFPSSIDAAHFNQARFIKEQTEDQRNIPYPRIGFFGVLDERMDIELVRSVAEKRPDWQLIMVGPVAKISPEILPRNPNIHYLGQKKYEELPFYLAGWNVAMLPFARNEATRYISPTKTPEYLAAGRPVVSTSIRDVIRPYGEMKLVHIADTADEFVQKIQKAMEQLHDKRWLMRVDAFLEGTSWDRTWSRMNHLISMTLKSRWLKDDYRRTAYVHSPLLDVIAKQGVSEDV